MKFNQVTVAEYSNGRKAKFNFPCLQVGIAGAFKNKKGTSDLLLNRAAIDLTGATDKVRFFLEDLNGQLFINFVKPGASAYDDSFPLAYSSKTKQGLRAASSSLIRALAHNLDLRDPQGIRHLIFRLEEDIKGITYRLVLEKEIRFEQNSPVEKTREPALLN